MNCPLCQAPNAPGAYYCSNCRQPLAYYPPQQPVNPYAYQQHPQYQQPASDRGVAVLVIFLGWRVFMMLAWLVIRELIVPSYRENSDIGSTDWESLSSLYEVVNWTTDIMTLLLVVALCIITKNKWARTGLIVYESCAILVTIIYKITGH